MKNSEKKKTFHLTVTKKKKGKTKQTKSKKKIIEDESTHISEAQ